MSLLFAAAEFKPVRQRFRVTVTEHHLDKRLPQVPLQCRSKQFPEAIIVISLASGPTAFTVDPRSFLSVPQLLTQFEVSKNFVYVFLRHGGVQITRELLDPYVTDSLRPSLPHRFLPAANHTGANIFQLSISLRFLSREKLLYDCTCSSEGIGRFLETGVSKVGGIRGTAGMGRELSVGDTREIVVQSFQGDVTGQRLSLRKNMGRNNVEVLHYKESIKFYSVKKKGQ